MTSLLRALLGIRFSSFQITVSLIFSLLLLFVPKSALAMGAMECFPHVENVTIDDLRYLQITREDRKECSLYLMAKSFPQLGEDGKPLPIQQQLRSIKAANDMLMEGKRGVRPVHSNCVPDSKPWSDQTLTEREMCAEQLVNYYPVTNQILIPKIPQLSKSEQIQELSAAACKALSEMPNPSDRAKKVLANCQKHYAGIVIPAKSVSPLKMKLTQAQAEVAALLDENATLVTTKEQQGEKLASITATSNSAQGVAVFFFVAFGLVLVDAVRSRRKNGMLQGRLNVAEKEVVQRADDEIKSRGVGPSLAEDESVWEQVVEAQRKLQEVTDEKTELSQKLAGASQQHDERIAEFTAEQDSLNEQIAVLGNKRDELVVEREAQAAKLVEAQERSGKLAEELADVEGKNNALTLQLGLLWKAEQRVRTEDIGKLCKSIELADSVIAELDKRHMTALANGEMKKAAEISARMEALNKIHETAAAEYKARSLALSVLTANDPNHTDPKLLLRALTDDAEGRIDNLASVMQMNLTLDKIYDKLSSDSDEAVTQLAELRRENADLTQTHNNLIGSLARALRLDVKALQAMKSREKQLEAIGFALGELKEQRLEQDDLHEQVGELQDRLDTAQTKIAAHNKAMEGDSSRQAVAAYEFTAMQAEIKVVEMGRRMDAMRTQLKEERGSKERLQEAVRRGDGSGLLALEATELVELPTQRIMHLAQQCVLAVHRQPKAADDAEWVVGSDEALSALNKFLHWPLVSENGYRLPPKLVAVFGPHMVFHVADEVCKLREEQEPARIPSVTPTMAPPAMPKPTGDMRKRTMQGLGAVSTEEVRKRTSPYPLADDALRPPMAPMIDLVTDPDDEGKPTH